MRGPYHFLLPLLSLFLTRVDLTDIYPLRIPVRIVKVMDGDTIHVRSGRRLLKVRLSRIDSPEKQQPFAKSGGDAGAFALKCALKVIHQKKDFVLTLERFDIYGRMLGDLSGLSLSLIKNGCAGLYPLAEFPSRGEKALFLVAYQQARQEHRGLWGMGGYENPKNFRKRSARRQWRR